MPLFLFSSSERLKEPLSLDDKLLCAFFLLGIQRQSPFINLISHRRSLPPSLSLSVCSVNKNDLRRKAMGSVLGAWGLE